MKLRRYVMQLAVAGVMATMAANPALADRKDRNTVIGLGVGALAGAVLSNGDPWVTVGGAAAGGVLGNVLTEDRREYKRSGRHHRNKHHHRKSRHRDRHDHDD